MARFYVRGEAVFAVLILVGIVLIGLAVWQFERPTASRWGAYSEPHREDTFLRLTANRFYQQSLGAEYQTINGVLLLVDPDEYARREGQLEIAISQDDRLRSNTLALKDIPAEGFAFIDLAPLRVALGKPVVLTVRLAEASGHVNLRYQRDGTKLKPGSLLYSDQAEQPVHIQHQGDLAFRVRYLASGREATGVPLYAWILFVGLTIGSIVLFARISLPVWPRLYWNWRMWMATGLAIGVAVYTGFYLLPLSSLPVNADMTKDMLYTATAARALRAGGVPVWHHLTCGGQPLFGNPEAGVFSISTLLALFTNEVIGLKLALILEIAAASLGAYVFARLFGLRHWGALLPAVVFPLCGFAVNRILIGHTSFIAGMAIMPWVLAAGYATMTANPRWVPIAAGLAAVAFLGGDTHVIVYAFLMLGVIAIVVAVKERRIGPLIVLLIIASIAAGLGAVKLLPTLEARQHFRSHNLPELVAPLWSQKQLLNVFIDRSVHVDPLDVLNGESEGWENIGLYVGPILLVLATLGLLVAPAPLRLLLGIVLVSSLVLGEGWLYHHVLRAVPYAGQILRLPSRLLLITAWAAMLLAGCAIDWLIKQRSRRMGMLLALIALLAVSIDVGSYAHQTLRRLEFVPSVALPRSTSVRAVEGATLHSENHPISLARAGYVIPGSCQDFNQQPPFTTAGNHPLAQDSSGTILASHKAADTLLIEAQEVPASIDVRIVDSPLLHIERGFVVPTQTVKGPLQIFALDKLLALEYRSAVLSTGTLYSAGYILLVVGPMVRQMLQERIERESRGGSGA